MLDAKLETQQAMAPLLKNRVLRRVIQTFTNDPSGDMDRWAGNPEVLRLLHEAKRRMDEGYATEDEMEALLLAHLEASIWAMPLCSYLRPSFAIACCALQP